MMLVLVTFSVVLVAVAAASAQHGLEPSACIAKHRLQSTHQFELDEPTLERALVLRGLSVPNDGSGGTLTQFLQKLLDRPRGGKINVVMQGAGMAAGFGLSSPSANFLHRFVKVLQSLNPNVTVKGINAAHGSSRPSFGLICAASLMPANEDVDLVLVEYNTKLGMDGEIMKPTTGHKLYERFIRRMLQWRGNPAVVIVQTSFPSNIWDIDMPFYKSTEDSYAVVHQYYSLPTISMRNALYLKQYNKESGFGREIRQEDGFHYNDLGHAYINDALAWLVQDALESMCSHGREPHLLQHTHRASKLAVHVAPAKGVSVASVHVRAPLRVPMLESAELEEGLDARYKMCVLASSLHTYVGAHDGWEYKPEHESSNKFGYLSVKHGSRLQLLVPRPANYKNETMVLYISQLKMPASAGIASTATVVCASGCTCADTVLTSEWAYGFAVMSLTPIDVPTFNGSTCTVEITHIKRHNPQPQARFMLTGFMFVVQDDLMNAGEPDAFYRYGEAGQ